MLTWSAKRRLLYLIIILAFLVLVGLLGYLRYQPIPSCQDGKKNQNELGIDCGGTCAAVCPKEIASIKTLWTRIFNVAPNKYDVAAAVENPNLAHSAARIKYIVKIWDKDNLLINTRRGEAFLNPGEKYIFFESRVDVGERTPERALFELTEPPIWQRVERESPLFDLDKKDFTNEPTPRFVAEISNPSLVNLEDIEVVAVLSGADENAIAVSSTLVDTLPKGETRELVFTWPEPFAETPVFFDLYTHFDLRKLP